MNLYAAPRLGQAACLACVMAVMALASGCQTRQPVEPGTDASVRAGSPIFFHPAAAQVPIMLGSGRYPTLFSGTSRATWIEPASAPAAPAPAGAGGDPEAAAMAEPVGGPGVDDEARMLAANFNVIACDIESSFNDTSIAYDVVGFRGITAYLLSADGTQVPPVQRIIGTDLREEQQGALKKYGRRNLLLFPRTPLTVATPVDGGQPPALRLVLEGYGAMFYFEFPAQVPGKIGPAPIGQQPWVQKGEEVYRKTREKGRGINQKFQ